MPVNSACANRLENYLTVLIDTHAATAALLAGEELVQAHGGCMINAAFTADGYGLVYVLYNNAASLPERERILYGLTEEAVSAVLCYDFTHDESYRLMDEEGYNWIAGFGHIAGTESLVAVDISTRRPCIVTIEDGQVTTTPLADCDLLSIDAERFTLGSKLHYSAASGLGIANGSLYLKQESGMLSLSPAIAFTATHKTLSLNDTLLLASPTTQTIAVCNTDEFLAGIKAGELSYSLHPLIALSPDGRYAAVSYLNDFLLLDLETGESVPLVLPTDYPIFNCLYWTNPDTLLVQQVSNPMKTVAFTLQ